MQRMVSGRPCLLSRMPYLDGSKRSRVTPASALDHTTVGRGHEIEGCHASRLDRRSVKAERYMAACCHTLRGTRRSDESALLPMVSGDKVAVCERQTLP